MVLYDICSLSLPPPTPSRGSRFILHSKKTAFIVEHDFIMATYLADRVVLYTGTPAVDCTATAYVDSLGFVFIFCGEAVPFLSLVFFPVEMLRH